MTAPRPAGRLNAPAWRVSGDVIQLDLGDGTVATPIAKCIFDAEFKGARTVDGVPVAAKPSQAIANVRFSRFPLAPAIALTTADRDGAPSIAVSVVVSDGERECAVPLFDASIPDHLILASTWYPLVEGALTELRGTLIGMGVKRLGRLTLKQYLEFKKHPPAAFRVIDRVVAPRQTKYADASLAVPRGQFAGRLYPYQHVGFCWLKFIAAEGLGCILADEMGLGKTIQLIALFVDESTAGRRPSLVVAPATLLENWRREVTKFAPGMSCVIHRGTERTGFPSYLRASDVTVTSYETAVNDLSLLRMVEWNVVVLDEAQSIKNPVAQRTKAIKKLSRRVSIAATGTPLENRLTDLWSLMDYSVPGLLGSIDAFVRDYSNDEAGAARLEPIVTPVMMRRTVSDVAADLPKRIDIPQVLEMDAGSAGEYEALRKKAATEYNRGGGFAVLTKLRMFCTHPALVLDDVRDPAQASAKYQRFIEITEEILSRSEKVVVFTSFTKMVDIMVSDVPRRAGLRAYWIDGRVAVPKRQPIIDEFQSGAGSAMLVLNPRAAGTGLNIPAANHVIHYNLEWNPAVEDQATARVHRRGQTKPVTVHRLIYARTVEEIIDRRVVQKRAMAKNAVVGTRGRTQDLSDIIDALKATPTAQEGME